MKWALEMEPGDVVPDRESVFAHQGIPVDADVSDRIAALYKDAESRFLECARPVGLISELPRSDFEDVFAGEGNNAADAVVGLIFPEADRLALYALTIGKDISERIESLFASNDFAVGSMLDSIASQAADRAAERVADHFHSHLLDAGLGTPEQCVFGYSPGYCGWDISGQRHLFAHLDPGQIGISLNSSYMMSPLKSITGLLVTAIPDSHLFKPRFSYCPECKDRPCIGRMQRIRAAAAERA